MDITSTSCCALSQMAHLSDKTSMQSINKMIREKRAQAIDESLDPYSYRKGETVLFAVTLENELILAKRLQKAGFTKLYTFKRRLCTLKLARQQGRFDGEELTMWIINLSPNINQ